jgi:hypothetical protein
MIWHPPAPEDTPIDRFNAIMSFLCDSIIIQGRELGLASTLMLMIWQRITRLSHRFTRILARGPARPTSRPNRRAPATQPVKPPADYRLPAGFAWLRKTIPGPISGTAFARAELEHLLTDPAMTALLESNPALGRILRPLCHALGIKRPPSLALPPPTPSPKRPKPPKPPEPPNHGLLPRPIPFAPGNRFWPPWNTRKTPT